MVATQHSGRQLRSGLIRLSSTAPMSRSVSRRFQKQLLAYISGSNTIPRQQRGENFAYRGHVSPLNTEVIQAVSHSSGIGIDVSSSSSPDDVSITPVPSSGADHGLRSRDEEVHTSDGEAHLSDDEAHPSDREAHPNNDDEAHPSDEEAHPSNDEAYPSDETHHSDDEAHPSNEEAYASDEETDLSDEETHPSDEHCSHAVDSVSDGANFPSGWPINEEWELDDVVEKMSLHSTWN